MNIDSNKIKIYPTATRTAENDYGANINLEQNIVGLSNSITDYNSYIIDGLDIDIITDGSNKKFKVSAGSCVINGYSIKISSEQVIPVNISTASEYTVYLKLNLQTDDNDVTSLKGIDEDNKYSGIILNASSSEIEATKEYLILCYASYNDAQGIQAWELTPTPKKNKFLVNHTQLKLNNIGLTSAVSDNYNYDGTFDNWLKDRFVIDDGDITDQQPVNTGIMQVLYDNNYILNIDLSTYSNPNLLRASMFPSANHILSVSIPSIVTEIANYCFSDFEKLEHVNYSSSCNITTIGQHAFLNCKKLKEIIVPKSVQHIGQEAYVNCIDITDIYIYMENCLDNLYQKDIFGISIPNFDLDNSNDVTIHFGSNVKNVPNYLFYTRSGPYKYTNIYFANIEKIGNEAFSGFYYMHSLNLPATLTSIGSSAFFHYLNLESITCLAVEPPTLGNGAFDDTNNCPIYVPSTSSSDYQREWADYSNRIQAISE